MIFDQMIQELNNLRAQYNKGNLTLEKLEANLKVFDATHKFISDKLQAYSISIKAGRYVRNMMEKDALIGAGSMPLQISSHAVEIEMIRCVGLNNALIARRDCLDYSGSSKFPECLCDQGKTTKNLLLGKPQDMVL